MDMNERQIALSVLESLRADLAYARLKDGSRILDVADLRQYVYEEMDRLRASAYLMGGLYDNHERQKQAGQKSNGANGGEQP